MSNCKDCLTNSELILNLVEKLERNEKLIMDLEREVKFLKCSGKVNLSDKLKREFK